MTGAENHKLIKPHLENVNTSDDKVVVCKYCGEKEYYMKMRWLNGKEMCRNCYKNEYKDTTGNLYKWDDLDGDRPKQSTFRKRDSIVETWEMMKILKEDKNAVFKHYEDDDLVVRLDPYTEIIKYKQESTGNILQFEISDKWIQIDGQLINDKTEKTI